MSDEPTRQDSEERSDDEQLDYSQATRYPKFYANFVTIQDSLFELRMNVSFLKGTDPKTGKLVVEDFLTILMSPELAATMHNLLASSLTKYQKKYGNLRKFPKASGSLEESDTDKSA